jgi:hypothetical protein
VTKRRRTKKSRRSLDPTSQSAFRLDASANAAIAEIRRVFEGTGVEVVVGDLSQHRDGLAVPMHFDQIAVALPEAALHRTEARRVWLESLVTQSFSNLLRRSVSRELASLGLVAGAVERDVGIKVMTRDGREVGVVAAQHMKPTAGGWIRGSFLRPGTHWELVRAVLEPTESSELPAGERTVLSAFPEDLPPKVAALGMKASRDVRDLDYRINSDRSDPDRCTRRN